MISQFCYCSEAVYVMILCEEVSNQNIIRCFQFESVRDCVVSPSCPPGRYFPEASRTSHTSAK